MILAASSSTRHRSMPDFWLHTLKAALALCTARSTSFSPEHSSLAITRPGHILSRKQTRRLSQGKGTEHTIRLAAQISAPPPAPGYGCNGSKQNPLSRDRFLSEMLQFGGVLRHIKLLISSWHYKLLRSPPLSFHHQHPATRSSSPLAPRHLAWGLPKARRGKTN